MSPQPPARAAAKPATRPKLSPEAALRRELWAILTLYAVLSILPLLIGLWLGA